MANYTWEFFLAIFLGVVALVIIGVLIFLLFNPKKDAFDKVKVSSVPSANVKRKMFLVNF